MHIVVINTKGGCGKTLVTTQLACYFACSGKTIAIVDHDPQQSSKDWAKARPKKCAAISCVVAGKSAPEQLPADITLHDMPAGYDILQIKKDVPSVSKLIIPLLPSPTDLRVLWRFCMALSYSGLRETGIDAGFIINRYRNNAAFNPIMMKFINRMDIPLIGQIRDTQNYIHAANRGLGIFDLPPHQTQIDRETWQPVIEWLGDKPQASFAQLLMKDLAAGKQLALV